MEAYRTGALLVVGTIALMGCPPAHVVGGTVVSATTVTYACVGDTVTVSATFCGAGATAVVGGATIPFVATPATVTPSGASVPCTNGMTGTAQVGLGLAGTTSIKVYAGDSAPFPLSITVIGTSPDQSIPITLGNSPPDCNPVGVSASPSVQVTGLELAWAPPWGSDPSVVVRSPQGGAQYFPTPPDGVVLPPAPDPATLDGTWTIGPCNPPSYVPTVFAQLSCMPHP